MPRYYNYDLARWEGEGGFHGELPRRSDNDPHVHGSIHPRNRTIRMDVHPLRGTRGLAHDVPRRGFNQSQDVRHSKP